MTDDPDDGAHRLRRRRRPPTVPRPPRFPQSPAAVAPARRLHDGLPGTVRSTSAAAETRPCRGGAGRQFQAWLDTARAPEGGKVAPSTPLTPTRRRRRRRRNALGARRATKHLRCTFPTAVVEASSDDAFHAKKSTPFRCLSQAPGLFSKFHWTPRRNHGRRARHTPKIPKVDVALSRGLGVALRR